MILNHYRSIDSALKEIQYSTFHFASREELNDPLEGYVRVFWQADRAAWEGLFRNYICSLSQAIDLYLLRCDEDLLYHKTLIADLHCFDDVPLGEILRDLGDKFLKDEEIRNIAAFYGNSKQKVHEEELRLILNSIHRKALSLCLQNNLELGKIPENEVEGLLRIFSSGKGSAYPEKLKDSGLIEPDKREAIARIASEALEDMMELLFVKFGFDDDFFLNRVQQACNEPKDKVELMKSRQKRNWMAIAVDFPKIYVDQLKDMIYPESFVVCFSGKNNDSSMWGNYADQHRGVCLVYETDENHCLQISSEKQSFRLHAKKVIYDGKTVERNFFETFGRLTMQQIKTWLTGIDSVSESIHAFKNIDAWRKSYWEANEARIYRKLKSWHHEDEYRISIDNMFHSFETPESRNMKYDRAALKGVIFGMRTSEYDRERVMKSLLEHSDNYTDFTFYQAEYTDSDVLNVRRKNFWSLKNDVV